MSENGIIRVAVPDSLSPLCAEGVTRRGELQPCDKPTVAFRIDPEEGTPYPVCAYHCRADMVPLVELLREAAEQ